MTRTVVKVGGARAVDPAGALGDVACLLGTDDGNEHDGPGEVGHEAVVVHGGSTAVDETLERLGIDPEYVETPDGVVGRFTDSETMAVVEMVLAGRLNTELVARLRSDGVDAVGLSGVDGGLVRGPRTSAVRVREDGRRKVRRGDHSGSPREVDACLLETLLGDGYTPVVSPPMAGIDMQDDGEVVVPVNTDADRVAAAVAGALDATLVVLTDVPGVLEEPGDGTTLLGRVETPEGWARLEGAAEGFMRRKVMAVREALAAGARRAVVAGANTERPVQSALAGGGTHVLPGALAGDSKADDEGCETGDGGVGR